MNYAKLLINKRRALHLSLIDMARKIGVSMPALHNYEQGLNVSDSSEEKMIAYIEGVA
jgi:transcriptional regulator with XRE-family HTH domain